MATGSGVLLVSIRIQSSSATCKELTALAGVMPTSCAESGRPVSARNPDGPRHELTTWTFSVEDAESNNLETSVARAIEVLGTQRDWPSDASFDVISRVEGRPMGNMFEIGPETLSAMARLGVGLAVDVYNSE